MKFENLAVGDTVLLHVERKVFSFTRNGRDTFVPITVEKVTKTQFTANGERFTREHGGRIGAAHSYWPAVYPVGENVLFQHTKRAVATTPEELEAIEAAMKVSRTIAKLCDKLARDSAPLEKLLHHPERAPELKEATDKLISILNSLA